MRCFFNYDCFVFVFLLNKNYTMKKLPAYNLQEILIVLVIIGILLLIALPNLMPLISKTKSIEAQTQLKHIYNSQKTHYYMYSKYANNLDDIDFETPKTVKENGTGNYNYEVLIASNTNFKARATAIIDFDGDGILNVWEINENGVPKQTIKD